MVQWLFYASVFLTVVFLSLGIIYLLFAPKKEIRERLQGQTGQEESGSAAYLPRSRGRFFNMLRLIGRAVPRRPQSIERLQKKLLQAHFYMRAEEFAGLVFLFGLAVFFLFYHLTGSFWLSLPAGLLGFRLPGLVVELQRKKRLRDLEKQLPAALGTIASGLRAGYSFSQALEVVCQEMAPPVSEEFGRVLRENRLGRPLDEALKESVSRVESSELEMVVSAIEIQRQVGGNLASLLDQIEKALLDRSELRAEVRSLTAQQRFSALVIFLLPPGVALLILLVNPEYLLPMVREPAGIFMLVAAIVLQFLGFLMIRRFMKVDI